jgi:uncharacterized protein YndB with AHSA1/START domain
MTDRFSVTRTLAAPRDLVWDLFTRPEHFSIWFGTEAVEVPLDTLSLDVEPGGVLNAVMLLPDGNRIEWEGEYVEVDRPDRLVFTLTDQPGTDPGEPIIVTFADAAGGTIVTLAQPAGGFDQSQVDATIAGYGSFFDAMERLLATIQR